MKPYPKYKPTKIEWIGEIPIHWEFRKISRSFEIIGSGTTPSASNEIYYENGTINWLITGDLNDGLLYDTKKKVTNKALEDYSTLKRFPQGSVAIAMYGATIGKVALLQIETTTNQACCVLAGSPYFSQKFIFYWFIASKRHIVSLGTGGGQPNVSQDVICTLKIPCPTSEEQTAIVSYLDGKTELIDESIKKKQQLIELLKEERTAAINEAVTKGINPKAEMKASGIKWLGDVPKHWEVKRLKYVISVQSGDGIKSDDIKLEGTYPVYGGNGITGYSEEFNSEEEEIIIGRVGAKCGNIHLASEKKWISDNALIAKTEANKKYLSILLKSMNLNSLANQNAQPLITGTMVKDKITAFPPPEEQTEIVSYIETTTAKIGNTISTLEKEIELLHEYRTVLISEVVTGKIDVREKKN